MEHGEIIGLLLGQIVKVVITVPLAIYLARAMGVAI